MCIVIRQAGCKGLIKPVVVTLHNTSNSLVVLSGYNDLNLEVLTLQ